MNIIYRPRGPALEYAELALTVYTGCTHGCTYCHAPGAMRKKRDAFYTNPKPRKALLDGVLKDAKNLSRFAGVPEILISFIGDPYQPVETDLKLTRKVLNILIKYNLPFTILTKGGRRAVPDFDLMSQYPGARFGTTLTFCYQDDLDKWEPDAAPLSDRIHAIAVAKDMGIPTWVSLEPVIDPDQALLIIGLYSRIVDHWWIGKINHDKAVADSIDWPAFVAEAQDKISRLGVNASFKKSLIN